MDTYIYIYTYIFLAVAINTAKWWLNVRTVSALQQRSRSSMARAVGEGAKLAAVPHKARKAAAKNEPVRHNIVIIQKCFGCRKSESSDKAKRACYNSSLDKLQIA